MGARDPSHDRLTLHVRLTRACNADCTYCSSWQESHADIMQPEAYRAALGFLIEEVLPVLGFGGAYGPGGHLSIQYIGGEILTVPRRSLRACVEAGRELMAPHFAHIRDGVQSNLIGSPDRVAQLSTLFGRNIGTSVDHFGDQRRLAGSAERYRTHLANRRADLKRRRGHVPAAIFVVDRQGLAHAEAELEIAERDGYDLRVRPVFQGGSAVDEATPADIRAVFERLFDRWAMQGSIVAEPFHHLLVSRLASVTGDTGLLALNQACPFQKNCAHVSLDLEPDGGLYICQDMADSDQYPLGNALTRSFDLETWEMLSRRQQHFDSHCRVCPWLAECQGGCMSEAIHHTGSAFGRTELCTVWKGLFARIDAVIAAHGADAVGAWVRGLGERRHAA